MRTMWLCGCYFFAPAHSCFARIYPHCVVGIDGVRSIDPSQRPESIAPGTAGGGSSGDACRNLPRCDNQRRRSRSCGRPLVLRRPAGAVTQRGHTRYRRKSFCIMGIGSDAWDRLFGQPRPAELHPFREIAAGPRRAVATPGDLLFHIRAKRMDLCFELATQIMTRLKGAVTPVDEVHGFRYFDNRDLMGFVDGTENPTAQSAIDAACIGPEDAAFAGGSYVIVQKYLHDMDGWNALSTEAQERIIGRTKLSDIELDDAVKPTSAHNALTTIVEDGKE